MLSLRKLLNYSYFSTFFFLLRKPFDISTFTVPIIPPKTMAKATYNTRFLFEFFSFSRKSNLTQLFGRSFATTLDAAFIWAYEMSDSTILMFSKISTYASIINIDSSCERDSISIISLSMALYPLK